MAVYSSTQEPLLDHDEITKIGLGEVTLVLYFTNNQLSPPAEFHDFQQIDFA